MKLRTMVGAFLTYKDKVLLIHRGLHKKLAPGMWSCVGGHMEPEELNNPIATCYREIEEETGILKQSIENLRLCYITTRNVDGEIRSGYYFTGNTTYQCGLPNCNEGTLHWVNIADIADLEMTFSIKQIITHWLNNKDAKNIMLCGINNDNDKITWVEL